MGKKKKNKLTGLALHQVLEHFDGDEFANLITFRRTFPGTARADCQKVLTEVLAEGRLLGLCRQWQHDALKFSDFLDTTQVPVMIGPVQYDEVDVGESEPLRCLNQGMWLLPGGLAVLMAQATSHSPNSGGVELELIASPQGDALARASQLLDRIEQGLTQARVYRGKVLSLESGDSYRGILGQVRVHRLAPVQREEVILPEKTLALLERNVHEFIARRKALRSLGMTSKKGLLFHGPPGTGKTHTVRYLASQLPEHTTFLITAEQVGKLPQYLQFARYLQPSIVVIEDVDLISKRRGEGGLRDEVLLNQLLNEMDGLREEAEILFVLTTNRPEVLESALSSRPGRVDQAIEFPLPDADGRARLLRLYAGRLELKSRQLKEAVERTQGASAAFIKELMRRTAQNMLRAGGEKVVESSHLREALEEMLFAGGSLNLKLLGASEMAG